MEIIKELRVVYESDKFFGGREQREDTTACLSLEKVQKSFRLLKKEPLTTAVWFTFDRYSKGFVFDNEQDALWNEVKIIWQSHERNETNTWKMPFDKAKHEIFSYFPKN